MNRQVMLRTREYLVVNPFWITEPVAPRWRTPGRRLMSFGITNLRGCPQGRRVWLGFRCGCQVLFGRDAETPWTPLRHHQSDTHPDCQCAEVG